MKIAHLIVVASLTALIVCASSHAQPHQGRAPYLPAPARTSYTDWVAKSLTEMETIKVGMTRGQLIKVFTTEGGLFSRTDEQFVYKDCPYFKVRVQFAPVGPDTGYSGNMSDKIVNISQPFLEDEVTD